MKTIIIGCTHAGTAAVQEILARDPQAEVAVYERRDDISFLSCGIYLYLEGVVDDLKKVFYATPDDLRKLGPNVHVNMKTDIIQVLPGKKQVEVQDLETGEKYFDTYDKLIMATGSYPIVPPIQGVNTPGVYMCKTYDDAQNIMAAIQDAKRVAVVGGGYIGTELAEALNRRGMDVVLVNGRQQILSHYVDGEIANVITENLRAHGVDVHDNEIAERFESDAAGVYIQTNQGEVDADVAILSVGFSPMTDLVCDLVDCTKQGALKVNDYMQTSNPDIYAAGDAAAVRFNVTNDYVYAPLATNAVRMGKIAGANIVEPGSLTYMGTQATSALSIFDHTMAATGLTEKYASLAFPGEAASVVVTDNYRPEFMPTNYQITMKLVYNWNNRQILGAQFYSESDISLAANLISVMIQNGNTIDDLAYVDMFFNPNFDRPWHYLNLLGMAAVNKENRS